MPRLSSVSARLVVAVLVTATVAFMASFGLTIIRLDQGLARQAEELTRLSEQKLARELDSRARLAGARVEALFGDAARRLEGIARRADVVKAVSSGNSITISAQLGVATKSADLDGILVVDARLGVLGADKAALNAAPADQGDVIDILATGQSLAAHPLAQQIRSIVADNDRQRRVVLRQIVALDETLAKAIGSKVTAPLAVVLVEPIFDDFGDVFAALVGYRTLRPQEATLVEFARLVDSGLLVLSGGRPISSAGVADGAIMLGPVPGSMLLRTGDGTHWSRCIVLLDQWQICSLAPMSELHALRDEMVRIGENEGRSLATWLIIVAFAALLSFAGVMLLLSRRISMPLLRITEAVRAVSRGDWKSEVVGVERVDEVGDIARAVVVLQRSLEERDRLRSDVAQAEGVRKRREELEDAIRRFDRIMRSMLLSVSDTVETMDETARELARMSAVAEGEAVEAAFVSENTVSNVSNVQSATESLSNAISETVSSIRETAHVVGASSTIAQAASAKAEELAHISRDIDAVVGAIEEIAARTNALALNATVQASRAAAGNGDFGAVVTDIRSLADRIDKASREIGDRMATIRGTTVETVGSVRSIVQRLDTVLQQTRTIALAMERQDAVTRQIADSMGAAANGTINVSSSVGRLKVTIEEARGASMKVVNKATDMADEAYRLDSTVKSFLREVTA